MLMWFQSRWLRSFEPFHSQKFYNLFIFLKLEILPRIRSSNHPLLTSGKQDLCFGTLCNLEAMVQNRKITPSLPPKIVLSFHSPMSIGQIFFKNWFAILFQKIFWVFKNLSLSIALLKFPIFSQPQKSTIACFWDDYFIPLNPSCGMYYV